MADIREQIEILVKLQGVEVEILNASQQIVTMNDEVKSLGQAAADFEAQVAQAKETLEELRKAYRELELETKVNAEKIVKSNEKLRTVKTNKEYQSILKEIEDMRKSNSGIEDRMIAMLDQLETQEGAVNEKETQLANFDQTCNTKKKAIADAVKQQEQALNRLEEKKSQIRSGADPNSVAILDDVKTKVRGQAVAPVEQAVCMGCHMNIPPQLYNELLRFDELRFCPHCNRIIYWREKDSE